MHPLSAEPAANRFRQPGVSPDGPLPLGRALGDRFGGQLGGLFADCARDVGAQLRAALPDDDALLALLSEQQRAGSPDGYTRHLIHADPLARFSAMLLVWRPGQASPVHGHRTWCAYRVLQGTLCERHYRWDATERVARLTGGAVREAGDVFSVPAGLGHIHALGNDGPAVAISLHLYGVDAQRIATGVNLPVDTA